MKLNNFLIFLFLTNLSFGQFQVTGEIKKIAENGFHEITLSPTIRSYSIQDLSDLRIFDSNKNEIPYFIKSNNDLLLNTFEEYTIISRSALSKKSSSIVISVPFLKKNNQLSLNIANSDATKSYSISGSNDQKEWFGLSNSQILTDLNSETETSVIKTITYPLNNYRFLKIDFDDQKTLPINILGAGKFNTQTQKSALQEIIPKNNSIINNSAKKETQIHVHFSSPQIINQIVFEISKPKYYSRTAVIYKKTKRRIKRKVEVYEDEIASFELNSNTTNSFIIQGLFEKDFFIKIENKDNLPLTISKIKYNQTPVSIIADLDANKKYILKTGNKGLMEPQYDLTNFKTNISNKLPKAEIFNIQQENNLKQNLKDKSFWQKSWFMWLCIFLGAATILFFTSSLIKDLKLKN